MAENSISPGFAKILYVSAGLTSVMTLPVIPVDPDPLSTGNEVRMNNGTPIAFGDAVTAFITLVKAVYHTTSDFTYAELWSKPTPESDPVFVEVVEVAISGTNATAAYPMAQYVMTHRTTGGGLHRLYLMNSSIPPNSRVSAPFGAGSAKAISDYMKGDNGWIIGRDGGRIVAPIAYTTKINDALRKKYMNL